jgi:hypothetical protein
MRTLGHQPEVEIGIGLRRGLICVMIALAPWVLRGQGEERQHRELPALGVSVPRGFYDEPITVQLTSPVPGAGIRYTTDGSEPTVSRSLDYQAPLTITNSLVLRAAAFNQQNRVTAVATHTYLFLDQVMQQPANPPNYSAGDSAWNGYPAAYAMDQRVVQDPLYRNRMQEALRSLPIISIACARNDLFGNRAGIYVHSLQRGEDWEKPGSAEMILTNGTTAFQCDCGLRIQGNYNRIPEKSPKHSFRLTFKQKFGPTKLRYRLFPDSPVDKFNTVVLRADYNNSWIHWDASGRRRAQRTRDAFMKDSHRAMGWVSGHNRYVHLYLDGLYWGVYDAAERPDENFAASYFGGSPEEYDIINESMVKGGTANAFRVLESIHGLSANRQYEKLQQHLSVPEFIDYLLLNFYGGNQDVGENKNWYAARRRAPGAKFQFLVWDGEQVLQGLRDDTVNSPFEAPFGLDEELRANAEYRLAFADRVQKHFFDDGALTPSAVEARWMKRAHEIDLAIIAESARWGAYRRSPPYTRDQDWLAEQNRLRQTYFPQRTKIVLRQLQDAGLYPKVYAPIWSRTNNTDNGNIELSLSSNQGGVIYYATNSLDPRVYGTGAVAPYAQVYSNVLSVHPPYEIKARVLKSAEWSALTEVDIKPTADR